MLKGIEECIECGEPAQYIRHTQFAGKHPFCRKHALEQKDFLEDNSYLDWEELSGQ